ncbi:MAG TPA: pilus assembly PilX N-terminal domain-containing protein [Gammaproteobacteria bacterium]|nr:pilus assembly PilX N-terminal domain-containing protein [Gammaproteobacteria bacterium]
MVASLMIMLILTILGITVMNMTTLEEKMAFNTEDRYRARYFAESATLSLGKDDNMLPSPNEPGVSVAVFPDLLEIAPELGMDSGTGEIRYRESTAIVNVRKINLKATHVGSGSTVNTSGVSPNGGVPIFQITVSATTKAGTTADSARTGFVFVGPTMVSQ